MKRLAALLALFCSSGCTCSAPASTDGNVAAPSATASAALTASATSSSPFVHHTGKTTPADIAVNNLTSQLNGQIKLMGARPKDMSVRASVVTVSLARFKILGKSEDLARAIELAEGATKIEEKSFDALFLRARGRAAAHRFEEALADLDAADKVAGALHAGRTTGTRAAIIIALGRYDDALPVVEKAARLTPDADSLAFHAYLLGLMGRLPEAESLFVQAEQKHRGTSPFGLAQIYFDRGSMWEKQGNLTEATALYKAAHARLPQHTHVAVHLAGLVPPSEGIAILEPVAKETDDPDVFAELGVLQNLVAEHSGDAMLEKAKTAYDELFAKLPSGYADHAGWFWTTTGGDPKKGLAAAQKNLAVRQTADAYELLLAAAEAAKDNSALCTGLKGAGALKYPSPPLRERVRQLSGKVGCGD